MEQTLQEGDRVKYTFQSWKKRTDKAFSTNYKNGYRLTSDLMVHTDKVKTGTFQRYSKGYMYNSRLVIMFDGHVKLSYISQSANVVKI